VVGIDAKLPGIERRLPGIEGRLIGIARRHVEIAPRHVEIDITKQVFRVSKNEYPCIQLKDIGLTITLYHHV